MGERGQDLMQQLTAIMTMRTTGQALPGGGVAFHVPVVSLGMACCTNSPACTFVGQPMPEAARDRFTEHEWAAIINKLETIATGAPRPCMGWAGLLCVGFCILAAKQHRAIANQTHLAGAVCGELSAEWEARNVEFKCFSSTHDAMGIMVTCNGPPAGQTAPPPVQMQAGGVAHPGVAPQQHYNAPPQQPFDPAVAYGAPAGPK